MLSQQSVIKTLPILLENTLSTGYSVLQLTTQIEQSNRYEICQWNYEGIALIHMKTTAVSCENRTDAQTGVNNVSLICMEENNQIATSLVIQFRIQSPVRVQVQCAVLTGNPFEEISSINISVKGN